MSRATLGANVAHAPHVSAPIAPTIADVWTELLAQRALLEQLLRARRPAVEYDEPRFLLAVAASVRNCAFNAAELQAHAEADTELRQVVGRLTIRQIGKRLHKLSGRTIVGLTVRRIGRDRGGVIWAVQMNDLHTESCAADDRSA